MTNRPPSILRRLLLWILSQPGGDALVGDLDELYEERVTRGRGPANLWYARQLLSAAVHYAVRRPTRRKGFAKKTRLLNDLGTDLRQALRALIRRPDFTATVVVTLALGIGATTAIFSVINGVLLRPLPYPESDRLVRVLQHHRDDADVTAGSVSREEFADLERLEGGVYESVAAFSTGTLVLTGAREPMEVSVAYVTAGFFRTLGVSTTHGRVLGAIDEPPGDDRAVVLSHAFWTNRFGADTRVLGGSVTLDGAAFTVLGVVPPSVDYPSPHTEVFLPVSLIGCDDVNCGRASRFLRVFARLAPDATITTASAAARILFERLERAFPETTDDRTATVISLHESLVGDVRSPLLILLAAVGFLLLIACTNVANLLLARGSNRSREFALRVALGAGRLRVMRYVLIESLALAVVGGALGFVLALRGVDLLVALGGGSIPRSYAIQIDLRVAVFALFTSLATGLLFGLLPSITASRMEVYDRLEVRGRGISPVAGRGLLVGLETALAVLLVTGAGLLIKNFWNLTRVDTGFTAEHVLSVSLRTDADVMRGEERNEYRREIVRRVEALRGVIAAGGAKDVPLNGVTEAYEFTLPDRPNDPAVRPQTLIVTGNYFEALGIPLLAGRLFTPADETDRRPVVIVNRAMARANWAGAGAVGETLQLFGRVPVEIAGVVGDVRYRGITQAPTPTLYVLPHFGGRAGMTIFVRTDADPLSMASAVRQAIWDVNPDQPLELSTMSQVVSTTVAQPRFLTVLLGSFAGLAIMLAMLGVYSVTAYEVSRRTRDVGVRIALGARARDVLRWIFAEWAVPILAGVAVGLAAARVLSTTLSALLYGVEATDPLVFTTVPLALAALGLLAAYLPARRAMRVDPTVALRTE